MREIVGELLANNKIRESQSAYANPVVLVRKKKITVIGFGKNIGPSMKII